MDFSDKTKSNIAINGVNTFLKWPGGKRWIFNNYKEIFPKSYSRYIDPFLGGGSIFYGLKPKIAIISDINEELINLYITMRDNYLLLAKYMKQHQNAHDKNYYYAIRNKEFKDPIKRAARLLYLNRTCFNGMYRVNKQGKFNVPIGTKNNCIYDIDDFEIYSNILKNAKIYTNDFETTIKFAKKDDFIFADPPYKTSKKQESFIKYNEKIFSWADQVRLFQCLCKAKKRGAKILLTNANCDEIKNMYLEEGFDLRIIKRSSLIAGKTSSRQIVQELVVSANINA